MDEHIKEHIDGVIEHKKQVAEYMEIVARALFQRAAVHDNSKFSPEEFDSFVETAPQLKHLTYGSEEYRQALKKIKPAIAHHYAVNDHHPEYFSSGVNEMNLIQIVEMVCDWLAAVKRVKDGDIYKSLKINKERFGIDDQLSSIIYNTVVTLHGPEIPDPNTLYPDVLLSGPVSHER
jgi:Family of unknown function (DUF5662)